MRRREKDWLKPSNVTYEMKYDCTRTMATITGMRTSVMFNWWQLYFGAFLKAQQYSLSTMHNAHCTHNGIKETQWENATQRNKTQSKQLHFHRQYQTVQTRILHAIFSLWACWTFPISWLKMRLTFQFIFKFCFRIIHEPNSRTVFSACDHKIIICHVSVMKMVFKNSCKFILLFFKLISHSVHLLCMRSKLDLLVRRENWKLKTSISSVQDIRSINHWRSVFGKLNQSKRHSTQCIRLLFNSRLQSTTETGASNKFTLHFKM